jgi:carbamate kinase
MPAMRVLVALGGNAMAAPDGQVRAQDQIAAAQVAMASVAELVADGLDVVITHGNGPQVGNLLVKNELAAAVVPPVPLDWCGAQTQATLGFILMNALDHALQQRGVHRRTAAVVTRTLVELDDPAFARPTKPIGRYLSRAEAEPLIAHGQQFEDRGPRGWRRVVPSPQPEAIIDADVIAALVDAGFVVVANGGGGIPVVREADGTLRGVEAVIDKDLGAALLAGVLHADRLVIATDIDAAMTDYGTSNAQPIGEITVSQLRRLEADGQFASGSMGPKVDAVCRFVESSGRPAVITSLSNIVGGVHETSGTRVVPDGGLAPPGTDVTPDHDRTN